MHFTGNLRSQIIKDCGWMSASNLISDDAGN